jgi:hypothetical protein
VIWSLDEMALSRIEYQTATVAPCLVF